MTGSTMTTTATGGPRMRGYLQMEPGEVVPGEGAAEAAAFGPEFGGVADYIDAITYAIWEGKDLELIKPYYSEKCPVHTLTGQAEGAEEVIGGTSRTLSGFPDRVLFPEGLVWGVEAAAEAGGPPQYHSSHLISTHMTNLGESEYGPATGRKARIRVIAHCVIEGTVIVKEWLVRDNFALATQLGFEPAAIARKWAEKPLEVRHAAWLQAEFERVTLLSGGGHFTPPDAEASAPHALVATALAAVWAAGASEKAVADMYHPHCWFEGPAGRDLVGRAEVAAHYQELLALLPGANFVVDYVCGNGGLGCGGSSGMPGDVWAAVRWTLAGMHTGEGRWGAPSGARVVLLGESHLLVRKGTVVRDITIFDELSILTQIERTRLG